MKPARIRILVRMAYEEGWHDSKVGWACEKLEESKLNFETSAVNKRLKKELRKNK